MFFSISAMAAIGPDPEIVRFIELTNLLIDPNNRNSQEKEHLAELKKLINKTTVAADNDVRLEGKLDLFTGLMQRVNVAIDARHAH